MHERLIYLSYTILGILIFIIGTLPIIVALSLAIYYEAGPWTMIPGLIVGVLLGLFSWGYFKFKWLLFIDKKINDKLILKEFIYKKNIITENNFLRKFEIISNNDRKKINEIIKNIKKSQFIDNINVKEWTKIKVGLLKIFLLLLIGIGSFLFSYLKMNCLAIGILVLVISIGFAMQPIIQINKMKLFIGNEGFRINNELISWNKIISNFVYEKLFSFGNSFGKEQILILEYYDKDQKKCRKKIKLNNLNLSKRKLEYLIYIYRNRYRLKKLKTANT